VYGFLEKNEAYYTGTRSVATVALMQSNSTLSLYAGVDIPWADLASQQARKADSIGNYTRTFYGYYELLLRARIPFDVIDEQSLTDGHATRYDFLILPNTACLSDAEIQAIAAYVRAGGRLIADFETSHYDETGQRRQDFGLAEVFGVRSGNRVSPFRRWDYVFVEQGRDTVFNGWKTNFIPAPRHNLEVDLRDGAQRYAVFSQPLVGNIVQSAEPSEHSVLVVNAYGEGKCFYFPALFGQFYAEMHPSMYPLILRNIIAGEITLPIDIRNVPHMLDTHLRVQKDPDRVLIHLVNAVLPDADHVAPAHNLAIELRLPQPARRVRALRAEQDLPFAPVNGGIAFTLPVLNEFEVILVEGAASSE
jgi:hypothetical protein